MKLKSLLFGFTFAMVFALWGASPKYVFLFIGDGMAVTQRKAAEDFSKKIGRGPLVMNSLPFKALTTTHSADKLVTDSAAAATAIACGVKTKNYTVGCDANDKPVSSCAVAAKEAGKKVGIISTVTITHATPAGFYAHQYKRGQLYPIAIDLAHSGFDFFAGGGLDFKYKDPKARGFEKYGHAYKYAESKGYKIIRKKEDFLNLKPSDGKILTRFTDGPLPSAIDIEDSKDYPSLAQLVAKGIEMLDGPQGFFMMAEGGRIDWAGHANDAATNVRESLGLDDAVKVALEFQNKHPDETLVIVTGDHETGGLTMGVAGTGYTYDLGVLAKQTMSVREFDRAFAKLFKDNNNITFEDAKPLINKAFGLSFSGKSSDKFSVNEKQLSIIKDAFNKDLALLKAKVAETKEYDAKKKYVFGMTLRNLLDRKAGVAWSTGGHTGQPVLTTAKGPGAELFTGKIDNTDIAKKIKSFYAK